MAEAKAKVETVPLYKFRNEEKKRKQYEDEITGLRADNQAKDATILSLGREVELAKQDLDEEADVQKVRQAITKEWADADAAKAQNTKDAANASEKLAKAEAKEMSVALKEEGIEATVDDLLAAENVEAHVSNLRIEHYKSVAEQKTGGKTKGAKAEGETEGETEASVAQGVFDTTGAGQVEKVPAKMPDDQFEKYWNDQVANAESR